MVNTAHKHATINEKTQRANLGLTGRPFVATIQGAPSEKEFISAISDYAGRIEGHVVHPYVGSESWHRVAPSSGEQVLVQMRMDTKEPSIIGYVGGDARNDTPERRVNAYYNGIGFYRPLGIGEQELVSSGVAQIFMGRRGILDQRAGYVRSWLDQDSLEAGSRAVTHVRELHLNVSGETGDEERFGGVTRPEEQSKVFRKFIDAPASTSSLPNTEVNVSAASDPETLASTAASTAESANPATEPAKEYMFVLKSGSGTVIDHREGHVIDDSGQPVQGKLDGELRYHKRIYGKLSADAVSGLADGVTSSGSGSECWEQQIDDSGNMYIGLPPTATTGIKFEIPAGKFSFKSGSATTILEMDGIEQTFKLATSAEATKFEGSASGLKVHSSQVKLGLTDAAVNKVYATVTKKAAQLTLHGGLSGSQLADGLLHTAESAANSALSAIHAAVCACPLTPGVIVGLLGIAHSVIPIVMRTTGSALKLAKSGFSGAYVGTQDTHESNTVSISS